MNKYELVIMIDSRNKKSDMEDSIKKVEDLLGEGLLQKDDIGFLDLAANMSGLDRAYFVSYEVSLDPSTIDSIKRDITLMKGVFRFFFYKMANNEKFFKFAEVDKKFEITQEEKEKQKQKGAFKDIENISRIKNSL